MKVSSSFAFNTFSKPCTSSSSDNTQLVWARPLCTYHHNAAFFFLCGTLALVPIFFHLAQPYGSCGLRCKNMHLTIFISNWFKYYIILICSKPKPNKRLAQPVTSFYHNLQLSFCCMTSRSNMEERQSRSWLALIKRCIDANRIYILHSNHNKLVPISF
jgi:hypothetical protein